MIAQLKSIAGSYFSHVMTWNAVTGFFSEGKAAKTPLESDRNYSNPARALEAIVTKHKRHLFIFQDFHPFMEDPTIIRTMRNLVSTLQESGSAVVFIAPKLVLPLELEKDVAVVDYPLPTLEEIRVLLMEIEHTIVKGNAQLKVDLSEAEHDQIIRAGLGLTENELRNVFAKALANNGTLDIHDLSLILSEKEQIVRKSGILDYYHPKENISQVGGLENVKNWLNKRQHAFSDKAAQFYLPPPKGVLLLGVPGCGKSLIAKAIASEWKQPLLKLDVGRLFGGLVGSSEENMRTMIQFAEAVSPAILWIDEIEKGFGDSGGNDGGTSARVFSTFLTWLQEKTAPVFVIATANDISKLPPEMLRKGRFDELFFVDLPRQRQRQDILEIQLRKRERDPVSYNIDLMECGKRMKDFSGAEIEEVVIAALYEAYDRGEDLSSSDVMSAIEKTIPLAQTMKESINNMRDWAKTRATPADGGERKLGGRNFSETLKSSPNLGEE